jgi:hypothetical protein
MNHSRILTASLLAVSGFVLAGADSDKTKSVTSVKPSPDATITRASPPTAEPGPVLRPDSAPDEHKPAGPGQASAYTLKWSSINGGGALGASSANYEMGLSVGQSVAGKASSAGFDMGVGFWYGAGAACPITMTGDVNSSGSITSADIIYCVNYVFKGGPSPLPCVAAADVNCSGSVTSADVIYLVNFVFKSGSAPCDACTLVPGTWSCP